MARNEQRRDVLRLRARRLALALGLFRGYDDYVRFIILGRSRTGSNMLKSALDGHSRMIVYGELFRKPGMIGWDRWPYVGPVYGQSRRLVSLAERHPIRFLDKHIFRSYTVPVDAVGFKMFYYYAHRSAWEQIWTWLEEDQQIHVLHLKRRNALRTFLSHVRAERTEHWISQPGEKQELPRCSLDADACESFFRKTREWEQEYDQRFSSHPKLDLYYEDLVADFGTELARVQSFLGVPGEQTPPRTRKQSGLPLSEAILNYDELRTRFLGTPWATYFEEVSPEDAVEALPWDS